MTDGEAFLLVFVLIYLSDCLVWLPPSGYALISFWRKSGLVRRARVSFEALGKGFAVLNPLPPLGTVFVGEAFPVSLDARGMAPFSRENPTPGPMLGGLPKTGFIAWEEIEKVKAEEGFLVVNGRRFARCATRSGAASLARTVDSIRAVEDGSEREAAIARWVRRRFDPRIAERRAAFFRRAVAPLRFSCVVLFVGVFFLLPFAYWRYQGELRFYLVLLGTWLLMWQIGVEFFLLHRRFYPRQKSDRWQHLVLALVFPHYAIRSLDLLSKGFLADSHPLAMAVALATIEEKRKLAREILRDARHPIPLAGGNDLAAEVAENFRGRHFLAAVEDRIERSAVLEEEEGEGSPEEAEGVGGENAIAVCPRCWTAYEAVGVPCDDCGGLITVKP